MSRDPERERADERMARLALYGPQARPSRHLVEPLDDSRLVRVLTPAEGKLHRLQEELRLDP